MKIADAVAHVIFAACLLFTVSDSCPSRPVSPKVVEIRGIVRDPTENVVAGAVVRFEAYKGKFVINAKGEIQVRHEDGHPVDKRGRFETARRVSTDDEGHFAADLPPGVYRVIAEGPPQKPSPAVAVPVCGGFGTFQSEPFRLRAGKKKELEITLQIWASPCVTITGDVKVTPR